MPVHPLDRVGVDVRRRHLDGGGQVHDQRHIGGGLDDVGDGVADIDGVLQFGAGIGLRAVLVAPERARILLGLLDALTRSVGCDGLDRFPVGTKYHAALQDRRRVVEVHDRARRAFTRQERAFDQLGPALRQHLDGDIVGDGALGDDFADEVEVGLARGWEADLDLLVAHADEQVEHAALAARAHRVYQRLVAVAEVDGTPHRGPVDDLFRPGAVKRNRHWARCRTPARHLVGEFAIAADRHRRSALGVPCRLARIGSAGRLTDLTYRRERVGGNHGRISRRWSRYLLRE